MTKPYGKLNHGYARVNGIRLHYAESGGGENLIILLHGFPEFWYSWRHQLDFLGERYHVVAPDMRGYNLSDKPPRVENYRLDVLVNDVTGLIQHFGTRQAAIVGHDWGAGVAWALALKYPEQISKLAVLQVPPAAVWRANLTLHQLFRSWYMFFFQIPRLPESIISRGDFTGLERMFKDKVGRAGAFTDADIDEYKQALRRPGALTGAINYYRANVFRVMWRPNAPATPATKNGQRGEATGSGSGRIRVPTLFIFGEQDFAILPETVHGVGNYVDAPYREVRIPDSGHWVQNEAAAEVNAALIEFLN